MPASDADRGYLLKATALETKSIEGEDAASADLSYKTGHFRARNCILEPCEMGVR